MGALNTSTNFIKNHGHSWVWWHTSVIPVLGRWRQEAFEFKAILGYIARLSLATGDRFHKTSPMLCL
jgi:hypothetical protein